MFQMNVTLLRPRSQTVCHDAPSAEAVYMFHASEFLVLGTWRSLLELTWIAVLAEVIVHRV
jgi:hypothetical protein